MSKKKHKFEDYGNEDVIWRGHDRHLSVLHYHLLSLILAFSIIFLSTKFGAIYLFLLIIPLTLSILKYIHVKKNLFELNTKRIVMTNYKLGKYVIYEVELYDVKHISVEEESNKKGYIIFQTASSLFPEIRSPWMKHPRKIHNIVRDISEELKLERNKLMMNNQQKKQGGEDGRQ